VVGYPRIPHHRVGNKIVVSVAKERCGHIGIVYTAATPSAQMALSLQSSYGGREHLVSVGFSGRSENASDNIHIGVLGGKLDGIIPRGDGFTLPASHSGAEYRIVTRRTVDNIPLCFDATSPSHKFNLGCGHG